MASKPLQGEVLKQVVVTMGAKDFREKKALCGWSWGKALWGREKGAIPRCERSGASRRRQALLPWVEYSPTAY